MSLFGVIGRGLRSVGRFGVSAAKAQLGISPRAMVPSNPGASAGLPNAQLSGFVGMGGGAPGAIVTGAGALTEAIGPGHLELERRMLERLGLPWNILSVGQPVPTSATRAVHRAARLLPGPGRRRRRLNPLNLRALRRAGKRVHGFRRIAAHFGLFPRSPRGGRAWTPKRRTRRRYGFMR